MRIYDEESGPVKWDDIIKAFEDMGTNISSIGFSLMSDIKPLLDKFSEDHVETPKARAQQRSRDDVARKRKQSRSKKFKPF